MTNLQIINIVGLCFISYSLIQWFSGIRFSSKFSFKELKTFLSITLRSKKVFAFIAGFSLILGSISQLFAPGLLPPFPILLVIGLSLIAINISCLPPSILFLGTSRPKGYGMIQKFDFLVPPLKIIHFLSTDWLNVYEFERLNQNNFRVFKDWKPIVKSLCFISPLIVIDTREVSNSVLEECNIIFSNKLHHKTIFISDNIGRTPVLDEMSNLPNDRLNILTLNNCARFLKGVGWSGTRLLLGSYSIKNHFLKIKFFSKKILSSIIIFISVGLIALFWKGPSIFSDQSSPVLLILIFIILISIREFFFLHETRSIDDFN